MKNEITMELLNKVGVEIGKLFSAYQGKINKTFCDDLEIAINLPVRITLDNGDIVVKTKIAFIESRVNDESVISINQGQRPLFKNE